MKITDSRVVSVELDNALETLQRTALGEGHDVTPAEAQALLVELECLQAMERRADEVASRRVRYHGSEEDGSRWSGTSAAAALYILTGEA